jgi:hypothetical protein
MYLTLLSCIISTLGILLPGEERKNVVRYTESEERENTVVKEATSAKNDYLTLGIHDQAARLDEKSIKLSYPIF